MLYDPRDYARLRNGVLAVSAAAWGALLALPAETCHGPAAAFGTSWQGSRAALESTALGWALMLVAMMAPMTLGALYQLRIGSFVRRRWRSSLLFLAGYAGVWMAAGVPLTTLELTARWLVPESSGPVVAGALVAGVWQASPVKQRCLNRCHAHRALRAFGLAADWDALRLGLAHGGWCVGSCWATMLLPMLLPTLVPGGHLLGMAAVTVLMVCERLDPPQAPAWRLRGFHTALLALRLRLFGARSTPPPRARDDAARSAASRYDATLQA